MVISETTHPISKIISVIGSYIILECIKWINDDVKNNSNTAAYGTLGTRSTPSNVLVKKENLLKYYVPTQQAVR